MELFNTQGSSNRTHIRSTNIYVSLASGEIQRREDLMDGYLRITDITEIQSSKGLCFVSVRKNNRLLL